MQWIAVLLALLFKASAPMRPGVSEWKEPGDYLMFAWEDIDEGLWRDLEFVRRNERLGRPVRVSAGGRETVELSALPVQ